MDSRLQIETLDEGYDARVLRRRFPFYAEQPI